MTPAEKRWRNTVHNVLGIYLYRKRILNIQRMTTNRAFSDHFVYRSKENISQLELSHVTAWLSNLVAEVVPVSSAEGRIQACLFQPSTFRPDDEWSSFFSHNSTQEISHSEKVQCAINTKMIKC